MNHRKKDVAHLILTRSVIDHASKSKKVRAEVRVNNRNVYRPSYILKKYSIKDGDHGSGVVETVHIHESKARHAKFNSLLLE